MRPIQDYTPAGKKTTASRSKPSKPTSNANHADLPMQPFLLYAQSKVPNFTIDATNQPVIVALLAYFCGNDVQCQNRGINPQKSLLLIGPLGCGKTTLMQLFSTVNHHRRFRLISTRDIARKFVEAGHSILDHYGAKSYKTKHQGYGPVLQYDEPITYCLDDLGTEPSAKHYGNDCNVVAEILLDRYDQFIRRGMVTHATTNLNADELERLYGDRVRSRLREMFNLIYFPEEAPDRRQ